MTRNDPIGKHSYTARYNSIYCGHVNKLCCPTIAKSTINTDIIMYLSMSSPFMISSAIGWMLLQKKVMVRIKFWYTWVKTSNYTFISIFFLPIFINDWLLIHINVTITISVTIGLSWSMETKVRAWQPQKLTFSKLIKRHNSETIYTVRHYN